MTGDFPEFEIDHKDRIRYNNIWKNLRKSTRSLNMLNRDTWGEVPEQGIHIQRGKYVVRVTISEGVRKYIGAFLTLPEAVIARDKEVFHHKI